MITRRLCGDGRIKTRRESKGVQDSEKKRKYEDV